MDPVTAAIVSAVSAGLTTVGKEAAKDAYHRIKIVIKEKLGIDKAIDALEKEPDSKERQEALAEKLAARNAEKDPELLLLATRLAEALKETEPGRKDSPKYHVETSAAKIGVIGDGTRIEGGIHFHHHHGNEATSASASAESAHRKPTIHKHSAEASPRTPSVQQLSSDQDPTKAHILHLSDLHFGTKADGQLWAGQLAEDLKRELNCPGLDAMIISGDVANFSVEEEYDAAKIFIERISAEFGLTTEKLIIVPGNHDLNWDLSEDSYNPVKRKKHTGKLVEGHYIVESETVILLRDEDTYKNRFLPFSKFYEDITADPYPLDPAGQGIIYHLKDLNLLVFGLNSAWQVDHHYNSRAGISPNALGTALDTIRNNSTYADCLKFAVWHHPLNSPFEDRIADHGVMERLAQSGFSVCFHGHLHKAMSQLFRYDRSAAGGRKIEIVGAGTFGAPTKDWYPGYPLQYNLLKISRQKITVETRCRREINGTWGPDAIWKQGAGKDPLPRYVIDLFPNETTASQPGLPSTTHLVEMPTLASDPRKPADTNLEADIDAYCRSAKALYENLPLVGFRTRLRVPIRIEDIYIPLRAMMDLRATGLSCFNDSEDAEKRVGDCDEIALPKAFQRVEEMGRRGIVILGDPGSGKTTHLKRLLLWCLRKGPGDLGLPEDVIPVFLPLRELKNLEKGLDVFIQDQLNNPHLKTPEGFGERLLRRGNLLFLLDGLDEVADAGQRVEVSKWINDAVRVHQSCRFVVTCRFAGYSQDAQLCEDFLQMHIRPLSHEEMKAFVRNWYGIVESALSKDPVQAEVLSKKNAHDLIERLEKPEFRSRRVFELTRNPLLLTNICLVHKDRGNLPHNRVRLYEECTDVLLELWRAAIGYETKIDARSGRRVLQPAALWLHGEDGRTRASAAELKPVIEPALRDVGWPHGNAEEFLGVVRDESGLLTGWDQEQYGFMHLGFQEYLVAREIQNSYHRDPKVLSDLADRFGESWWQEVTLLLLALDNPCLFEQFMRILIQKPSFAQHPELVEMCLEDAAEKPLRPFLEVLNAEPGIDPNHWQRQLAALNLVERLDNTVLNGLIQKMAEHPFNKIRERVGQRADRAGRKADGKIITAPRRGYELVWIPEGQFCMGSPVKEKGRFKGEKPQRTVRISGFYMGRCPVTNEEYGRFLTENPQATEPKYWSDRQYNQSTQPVVGVSWEDARQYAKWAGLQLPSEAQWEYACRAGNPTPYCSGDKVKDLDRVGWYAENSNGRLHPVGEKEPNEFGLYDMHGNVWEWVEDDWHFSYKGAPDDGSAWINDPRGSARVIRGGCWVDPAEYCRSACRGRFVSGYRRIILGFRLVLPPG